MSLINCEINLTLTWSDKSVLSYDAKVTTSAITDTKLYIPVVTFSIQDNAKLLRQLKSGFKRTIKWNKYQPKVTIQSPNPYYPYLDYLIVNKLFVSLFENTTDRTIHRKYYLPSVEI